MSWSFNVPPGPASGFTTRAQSATDAWITANPDTATDEVRQQITCCIGAGAALLGGVSNADEDVVASFSGHANPGHEVPDGSSSGPDSTSVSVYRRIATPA
jgi:hypothetical protein